MLQAISINNFQSLRAIDLDLSRFTVIVGPSSSGKSAFVRALHTLTNNRRGLDFLTHGERLMTITARTEHSTITLSRGKGTEDNYYEVIPIGFEPGTTVIPQRWSKLGGQVPAEVSAALGIEPGPAAFAGQHDMPYLLADSAASNATALGRLTNVTVIFDAAREAKRRALDASKTIRLRAADLEQATASLGRFEHLDEQQHALSMAEEKISSAYAAARTIERITAARDSLIAAATAVRTLTSAAAIEVPSLDPLYTAQQRINALAAARDELIEAAGDIRSLTDRLSTLDGEQQDIDTERQNMRDNTENIFRERFEEQAHIDQTGALVHIDHAAAVAAKTVEDISA